LWSIPVASSAATGKLGRKFHPATYFTAILMDKDPFVTPKEQKI